MSQPSAARLCRNAGLTRRRLLVTVGGVTVAAFLCPSAVLADDDVAAAPRAERPATLAALLAAVAAGPAGGMNDGVIAAYVERYSAYRAEADPVFVAYADAALDDIGATGIGRLEPPAALAQIRSWAEDGQHAARAAAALDLTRLAFEEDEARQAGLLVLEELTR